MKFTYWNVKARNALILSILEFSQVPYDWNKSPDWPAFKDQTPFGQLPFLQDGDLKIGQSMAIARYVSRKAGLQGENDADFATSEQLIEEQTDLYNIIAKAQYSTDKAAAWKNALEVELPKHFDALEKLLKGSIFASKITAGDLAIFSILNIILDLDANILDKHQKLKAFYEHIAGTDGAKRYLALAIPAYFKKE